MDSLDNQQTWVPYENGKDCSQGFCSLYCPQWCYIVFPPPPPLQFHRDDSDVNLSPLVIVIIGILASSFLLVSYYTLGSKYCGNVDSVGRRLQGDRDEEFNGSHSPSGNDQWQAATTGLDEAFIKSITVCKYKKGDGLVELTDCSVCLSEFQEGESLRLLPKCSHAFHLPCIDIWLKSHSNCPLCRAGIVSTSSLPPQLQMPVLESPPNYVSSTENQHGNYAVVVNEDLETGEFEPSSASGADVPKSPMRILSDLYGSEERDTIIEIREPEIQPVRRSFSMNYSCQNRVSIADVLVMCMEENYRVNNQQDCQFPVDVGSSKQCGEHSKGGNRRRGLHFVMSPTAVKRSSSGGRFFTSHPRGSNAAFPIWN